MTSRTPPESAVAEVGATLGQLRELTFDLPDSTLIEVVIRKAHDPDRFYEYVRCESEPHVDLTGGVVVLTAPEPRDIDFEPLAVGREAFHDTRADDFYREQMERADREDAAAPSQDSEQ